MSGHISHVAMQGSPLLERVVTGAVEAVVATVDADQAGDTVLARRIILAGALAGLAMFHPGLPAIMGVDVIRDTTPELAEAFRDLQEAVAEGARYGLITPALLPLSRSGESRRPLPEIVPPSCPGQHRRLLQDAF